MFGKSMRSTRKKNKKSEESARKKKTSVTKKSPAPSERGKKGSKGKLSGRSEKPTKKGSASSADPSIFDKKAKKPSGPVKEPWPSEEAAKRMVSSGIFKEDTLINEYKSIGNPKPSPGEIGQFQVNLAKNRNKEWPIADGKLVKFTAPPMNYISAARVTVPELNRKVIVTQVPDPGVPGQVEDFWRMIFQEECFSVLLASSPPELTLQQLLPIAMGTFSNHGKMFLNNRKVDVSVSGCTGYNIELLPDGCSNSINVVVWHLANWKSKKAPETFGDVVGGVEKVLKATGNICTMSPSGLGRSGSLTLLLSAMAQLAIPRDPKVKETLEKLRIERSGLIENPEQYVGVYKALAFWIKQKASDEGGEMSKKIGEFCPKA